MSVPDLSGRVWGAAFFVPTLTLVKPKAGQMHYRHGAPRKPGAS